MVIPGATAFTRTPEGPNSAAQLRVSWSTVALLAAYSAPDGTPTVAIHELRFTITPFPRSTMGAAIACVRNIGARTLTAITASNSAWPSVSVGAAGNTPALLTRMSMRPPSTAVASVASAVTASTDAPRSAATKSAWPPSARILSTTAAPRSASRPATATCAPSAA